MNSLLKFNSSLPLFHSFSFHPFFFFSSSIHNNNLKSPFNNKDKPNSIHTEEVLASKEYLELQKKYKEQLNRTESFKLKFQQVRILYLNNQKDIENIKKRQQAEIENVKKINKIKFIKDLLDFNDTFKEALNCTEKFDKLENDEEKINMIHTIKDSIHIVQNSLKRVFNKYEVQEFTPKVNDKFDPNLHEIILEYADKKNKTGTIGKIFNSGYKSNNITIRPARIAIINNENKKI